ncbi:MAG: META domain-containing protein [Bryobacteraceae bacterium]
MHKVLFLAALGAAIVFAADGMLEDTNWVALEVMGKTITKSEGRPAVHIQLHSIDKKLTGFSGCNSVFGEFEFSHEGLKFAPVGATRMACLDANVEPQFLEALSGTKSYRIAGEELQLMNMDGKVIGRFQASGPAPPEAAPIKQ